MSSAPPPVPFRDPTGTLLFLGTGTSVGVPTVGCDCAVCMSDDPRNKRTRTSVLLGLPGGTLLVDTTPDLRTQLLRERVGRVDAVLYTHDHVDHLYGLDDVRPLCHWRGGPIPVWCEEQVEKRIRRAFDYAFQPMPLPGGGIPKLEFERIGEDPFDLLGCRVVPLRLRHGVFDVLGFRFGDVAYCTDTNSIPEETFERLAGVEVFIVDCLRHTRHPTHFSLEESLAAAKRVGARRTILVHLGHELDHEATSKSLPAGVEMAWDGLAVPLVGV